MKRVIIFFVLVINSAFSFSQDTITIYLDKNNNRLRDTTGYIYYRDLVWDSLSNHFIAFDYHRDGNLRMKGQYKNLQLVATGEFVFYYENGTKSAVFNYTEGKRSGSGEYWYMNGKLAKQTKIIGNRERVYFSWDPYGNTMVTDGNGFHREYYEDTLAVLCEGNYLAGLQDGSWTFYHRSGNKWKAEQWKEGNLIFSNSTEKKEDVSICIVEKNATFPGGDDSLLHYMRTNLRYPAEAKAQRITGKVYVEFVVQKDGSIANVVIKRGVHPLLDEEAVRLVSSMPNWIPGTQMGKPVSTRFVLPIMFH